MVFIDADKSDEVMTYLAVLLQMAGTKRCTSINSEYLLWNH